MLTLICSEKAHPASRCAFGGLPPLLCGQPPPCVPWEAWAREAHTHYAVSQPRTRVRVPASFSAVGQGLGMAWAVLRAPHTEQSQAWAPAREAGRGSPHLGYGRRMGPEPVLRPVSWHRSAMTLGGSSLERPTEPPSKPCGTTCGLPLSEVVTVASFSTAGKCSL